MRWDRSEVYQWALIVLSGLATVMFGFFVFKEMFPEYKVYQNAYVNLESFRSSYTGEPSPPFKGGIKQIVMNRADRGPEAIDRCITCHVSLKFSHFSPTAVSYDINGQLVRDESGKPILVKNEDYVFDRLDQKIEELKSENKTYEADQLALLKSFTVDGVEVPAEKVLSMHPLIGKETRPFEFHNPDEIGCVVCHNGNGRSVTSQRAHGPVFDGKYHESNEGHSVKFIEDDLENDPVISKVFNSKPGHELLFQTTPLYVDHLMEARCAQCHQSNKDDLKDAFKKIEVMQTRKSDESSLIERSIQEEKESLAALLETKSYIESKGVKETLTALNKRLKDYDLPEVSRKKMQARVAYLEAAYRKHNSDQKELLAFLDHEISKYFSSAGQKDDFLSRAVKSGKPLRNYVQLHFDRDVKKAKIENIESTVSVLKSLKNPLQVMLQDASFNRSVMGDAEVLMGSYNRGKSLFINNACYACHKISGLSRGQVGPELTSIGLQYPWYVKESIVWPQRNLKTSTMPNFRFDHEEVGDLLTFLMAQRNERKNISSFDKEVLTKEWEGGEKVAIEKELPTEEWTNLQVGMEIYTKEGCASCHRLKGFDTDVVYSIEVDQNSNLEQLQKEKRWFSNLVPEGILGSSLVDVIKQNSSELDRRLSVRENSSSILEKMDREDPKLLESFYSEFKHALRAKNAHFDKLLSHASNEKTKERIQKEKDHYQSLVKKILMMYIREYGLGRDIAPRLHWSGIYRDKKWLIGHFKNPSSHTAKSIMPAMPFDESKFYSLTYMLQALAKKNRNELRQLWDKQGFDPSYAYQLHCSQCHGENFHGNGSVAKWIYPLPKNLKDPTFMRNLSKEKAIESIRFGVNGTPMPPWGVAASKDFVGDDQPILRRGEIETLVEWLYTSLPGEKVIPSNSKTNKWEYQPEDVLKDLYQEGDSLNRSSGQTQNTNQDLHSGLNGEIFQNIFFGSKVKEDVEHLEVLDVFEEQESTSGVKSFYIKRDYYTKANLEAGEKQFLANCSHCHGKEAAGDGPRSVSMLEAKPRMLTNLPWLESRDDLRLLQSIKYGVPGTAMTHWGDKTSTLQRLQMVMFIRSLSEEKSGREALDSALFDSYENMAESVRQARNLEGIKWRGLQAELEDAYKERQKLHQATYENRTAVQTAAKAYSRELFIMTELSKHDEIDNTLKKLQESLIDEKGVFQDIGLQVIGKKLSWEILDEVLRVCSMSKKRFQFVNNELVYNEGLPDAKEFQHRVILILDSLNTVTEKLKNELELVNSQLPSPTRDDHLIQLRNQLDGVEKVKQSLVSGSKHAKQLQEAQWSLFEDYKKKADTLMSKVKSA